MSKVSIIVPVYNAQNSIRRCVESILNQDYRNFELILIDDGSKDDSFKIISEYASKDNRIIAIHKQNSGVSATRNLGIEKASGEYLQFIDVDDWLPFDSTKLLVRSIEEDDSQLVVADFYRVVDDKSYRKGSFRKGGVISLNEYADRMLLTPADFYFGVLWNKLYLRRIIVENNIRMDENISFAEDAIFNLQYLKYVNSVSILKSPVYYYVKTQGSLVDKNINIPNIVKMKANVIKYYDDFYRHILSEEEYEARKPIIYGYLVSISTDGFNMPLIDEEKKVNVTQFCDHDINANYIRLSKLVLTRLLNALGQANALDENEIRTLYFMYQNNREFTVEQIAQALDMNQAQTLMILSKLVAGSYLKITDFSLEQLKITYRYISCDLDGQFDKIDDDFKKLCYEGLDDNQIKEYESIQKLIINNLGKIVSRD